MDQYGSPTNKELKIIQDWDFGKHSVIDFLEHIRQCWNWADTRYQLTGKRVLRLYLSTGGWSGNEAVIEAMQHNWIFWMLCWQKSVRGGHYWFKIRLKSFEKKD